MITTLGAYFGDAAAREARRMVRMSGRAATTPHVSTRGITATGTRADVRRMRKEKHQGDGVSIQQKPRKTKPEYIGPPAPIDITGTGATGTGSGTCETTSTLGSCLQCCSHNTRGAARRACKRMCDARFSAGGVVGTGGGGSGDGSGAGSGCGVVCVSGTSGDNQTCHYECPSYGLPPGVTPTTPGGGIPPTGGITAVGGTLEEEAATEQPFFEQYKTPIVAAGIGFVILLAFRATRKGR